MHTPGNWKVYGSTQYAGFKVVDAAGRSVAAFPSTSKRDDQERAANARLIAEAPELLAIVQAFVQQEVEYMTINNLGDPEQQHNVKRARAVFARLNGASQ